MKKLIALLLAITMITSLAIPAFATEPTEYGLYVAGMQITSANPVIDSTDNGQIQGSATFDEATKTFTLTNFKYTGAHDHGSDYDTSALSVRVNGITIVFSGENIIEGTGSHGLLADVAENIKLQAADENSTLTFKCENNNAFAHEPVLVGDIDIYAGSNEGDATLLAYDVFTEYPYSYKYVRFVPAEPEPETKSTTVTFNVDPTYTVTIPATVELDKTTAQDGTVTYEKDYIITADAGVKLKKNDCIEITLSTDNTMTTPEGATLAYTITQNGNPVDNNGLVAKFDTSTEEQSATIHIAANNPEFAGEYSDTVVFTISVKKELISFTIGETPYQAEPGMTWGEWVESEYDTNDKWEWDANAIGNTDWAEIGWYIVNNPGATNASWDKVFEDDEIQADAAYILLLNEEM